MNDLSPRPQPGPDKPPSTLNSPLASRPSVNGRSGPVITGQMTDSELSEAMTAPPASPEALTRRVAALLSHYYQPDVAADARIMADRDWVEALAGIPAWAVGKACSEWVREESRRPAPADIRRLALAKLDRVRAEQAHRAPAVPEPLPVIDEAERARRAAVVAQLVGGVAAKRPPVERPEDAA